MKMYHGSPELFRAFDLSRAGEGTGVKFGFGVYLTESVASAVHYSQPRNMPPVRDHYLYTVEIPDLTDDNHLTSALPVHSAIVQRVASRLGVTVPADKAAVGKEFRKWVGCRLTGATKAAFAEEKAAAELLNSLGVLYNVWPQAQTKPDGLKNIAVFSAEHICITRIEHIEVEVKCGKNVLIANSQQEIRL